MNKGAVADNGREVPWLNEMQTSFQRLTNFSWILLGCSCPRKFEQKEKQRAGLL